MSREKIAEPDELQPGDRKSVIVDDLPALLFRVDDSYYCVEDVCTHDGQPMTDGPLDGCTLTCPRHGAEFDIRNGKPLKMPATEAIRVYSVDVDRDGVHAVVE